MSSYESFARVYDLFMDNIPYGRVVCISHRAFERI